MILMLVLLFGYRRLVRYSERYSTITEKGFRPRIIPISKCRYSSLSMCVGYFIVPVDAPIVILFWACLLPSYHISSYEALSLVSLANYLQILAMPNLGSIVWSTLLLMVIAA